MKRVLQITVAYLACLAALDLACAGNGAFNQSAVTQEILNRRESVDIIDLIARDIRFGEELRLRPSLPSIWGLSDRYLLASRKKLKYTEKNEETKNIRGHIRMTRYAVIRR